MTAPRRHGFAVPATPLVRAEDTARVVSWVMPSIKPADAKNKLQYAWKYSICVPASSDQDATQRTTNPESAANTVANDRAFIVG